MKAENKICLITGGTSGIGLVTSKSLAKDGYTVILAVRNAEKGENIKNEIIRETGNNDVEWMECDLSSFKSIRKFTENFRAKYDRIDVLINNAGLWEVRRHESADGIEMMFAVNHLGPFLLTNLLLDLIKAAAPSRIINVASAAHKFGKMNFDDFEGKKSWGSMKSYAQSKIAVILFTKKLAEILKGTGVTVNCLHPGIVATRLFDKMGKIQNIIMNPFMLSAEKGAETTIYLATSPEVGNITGEYFAKKKIARSTPESRDMSKAERLWKISEQLTIDNAK